MSLPKSDQAKIQFELDRGFPKRAAKLLSTFLDLSPVPINTVGHASVSRLAVRILMAFRASGIPPNSDLVVIFDRVTSTSRQERDFSGHTARKADKRKRVVQSAALMGLRQDASFNNVELARRASCNEKYIRLLRKDADFWDEVDREAARQSRERKQAQSSPVVAAVRARLSMSSVPEPIRAVPPTEAPALPPTPDRA